MNRDAYQADEQTTTDPNVTNRHHSVSKLVNLADRYTLFNTRFYLIFGCIVWLKRLNLDQPNTEKTAFDL